MEKLIITAIAFLLFIPLASAQSNVEEVEFFQSIFGSEKKAIMADVPNLEVFFLSAIRVSILEDILLIGELN